MNVVVESLNLSSVRSDEDQPNCISTDDIEGRYNLIFVLFNWKI